MSWSKYSAAAGLGGMTPREAGRAALTLEDFQLIHDPLPDPDPAYGELIKVLKVSTFINILNTLLNICRTCRTV